MTNTTTPIQTAFEMQRQSTTQGQKLFEQGLDIQRNAMETFLHNGLAAQRSAQKQGAEFAHELTNTQIAAFEAAVDENEGEIRSAMDEQFEQNAALTKRLLDAQFEQGADLVQGLMNAQFDAFQSAFDDAEFDLRSRVDEQFEALDESQEEAWDEFESAFQEALDDLSEQQKVLVAESVEAFLDAHRETEAQTIEGVQRTEEATETARRQTEEVARTAQERAQSVTVEITDAAEEQLEAQVQAIDGLGSTYADRLQNQGIDSLEALSEANADAIAQAAEVSEELAAEWIEAAQSQRKSL